MAIWKTPGYPDYHWIAQPNLDKRFGKGFTGRIQKAILSWRPSNPEQKQILSLFGAQQFTTANANAYGRIEQVDAADPGFVHHIGDEATIAGHLERLDIPGFGGCAGGEPAGGGIERAEALHNDPDFAKLPAVRQREVLRREAFEPVLTIYRTMANLHYVDNHLDPSARDYGSIFSSRPDLMNWKFFGFGRQATRERNRVSHAS